MAAEPESRGIAHPSEALQAGVMRLLQAAVAIAAVLVILPATYYGLGLLAPYDAATHYLAATVFLVVLVLVLRPALPGIMLRRLRSPKEGTDSEAMEDLVLIIDISKIARQDLRAIEDALPDIQYPMLREGMALAVDGLEPEFIKENLSLRIEKERLEFSRDARAARDGAGIAILGALLVVGAMVWLGQGGGALPVAGVLTLGLSWFFIFRLLERQILRVAERTRRHHQMIRDGVVMVSEGELPDLVEYRLLNYLSRTALVTYEKLKFEPDAPPS